MMMLCGWCPGAGFGLRKDDPTTLKDLLVELQSKATTVDVSSFSDPYVNIEY